MAMGVAVALVCGSLSLSAGSGQAAEPATLIAGPALPVAPNSTATAGLAADAIPADYAAAPAAPDWLKAVNVYRTAAGVGTVVDNPTWSASIVAHLKYTILNNAPGHGESASLPYYTAEGAKAGMSSNLAWNSDVQTPVEDITGWMAAPYHGVGVLRSQLTTVAYGNYQSKTGVYRYGAGLDVIRGLNYNKAAATAPILFPGPGLAVPTGAYAGNETPSPIPACGWQGLDGANRYVKGKLTYLGLPIIVMFPGTPPAGITATIVGKKGRVIASTATKDLCTVRSDTENAVFLITKLVLQNGNYRITLTGSDKTSRTWAFNVNSALTMPTLGCNGIPDVTASNKLCGDIRWLLDSKITSLDLDGGFHPSDPVARGAVAAFLYRAMNPGTKAPKCTVAPYPDVPTSYTLCGEVAWLKALGVPLAFADGTFRSGKAMDRATLALLMYRVAHPGKGAPGCAERPLLDVAVSNPACGAIAYVTEQNLLPLRPDGMFKPASPVQRQNLATLLRFAAAQA